MDSRLGPWVAKAVTAGYKVQADAGASVVVVKPRSYSKPVVVLFSVVFVFAWLVFGVEGCAFGVLPLALYALVYLLSRDKICEIYLDDEGTVKWR